MRTMYIILSWIGWGWLLIAGTFLSIALYRQGRRARRSGLVVTPVDPLGTEADVRP